MKTAQVDPLWRLVSTRMPHKWGRFAPIGLQREGANAPPETALAIVMGDLTEGVPLLRIHSQCFTGEVLGSLRCDCHDQLEMAMQAIAWNGVEVVVHPACEAASTPHSFAYLRTKKERMGPALSLRQPESTTQTRD